MGITRGIANGRSHSRFLVLEEGRDRLYNFPGQDAPVWVRQWGPWRRVLGVQWRSLDRVPGKWWSGAWGPYIAIMGQGRRPAFVVERIGTSWRAVIPSGGQSVIIQMPDACEYRVRPLRFFS